MCQGDGCCGRWRQWMQPVLLAAYGLLLMAAFPFLIAVFLEKGYSAAQQGTILGGILVLMTLPVSLWDITQHLAHFTKPHLQRHIVRILWMVPIYSVNAWAGLAFPPAALYLDSLRECYEAYAIYNFWRFLTNFLEHEQLDPEMAPHDKQQVRHIFPLCFLAAADNGPELEHLCKHGVLQYVMLRPATTFISFICQLSGVYGDGELVPTVAFPYLLMVNNVSQFAAMYCLVLFYKAHRQRLAPMRPLPKFLCIKAVVFFSFFQGLVVALLVRVGVVPVVALGFNDDADGQRRAAAALQDGLLCVEMFWASVAHHAAFPATDYALHTERSFCESLLRMCDVSDVRTDISDHLGLVSSSLVRTRRPNYMPIPTERTRLYSGSSSSDANATPELPAPAYYHSFA